MLTERFQAMYVLSAREVDGFHEKHRFDVTVKKMRLPTSTFLSALFIFASVKAELNENCQVKNKYEGTCTYLTNCPYYHNMIQNYESLGLQSQDIFQIFREINCGFIVSDALVCCPPDSSTERPDSPLNDSAPLPDEGSYANGIEWTTQEPTTRINPAFGFPHSPIKQSEQNPKPIVTTTPTPPMTSFQDTTYPGIDINKFKLLLPPQCGKVLTFKYFRGNRTEFGDFPWTTLVEYDTPSGKQFGCGGALIHNRYVLTAAHCVAGLSPSWKVSSVRFGEYDTANNVDCLPDGPNITVCNDQPVDVAVEEVIVHPAFIATELNRFHDIALLRLSKPVNFTYVIQPVCLPTKNPFLQKYYTSGWGKDLVQNSIREGTNLKYMSYVSLVNQTHCQNRYRDDGVKISPFHICGGTETSEKPCIGDAGGPLMGLEELPSLEKRVTAFGVLSMNKPAIGDCLSGNPGVYTNVLDYMSWILDNIKPEA